VERDGFIMLSEVNVCRSYLLSLTGGKRTSITIFFYTYGKQKKDTTIFSKFALSEQMLGITKKNALFSKHLKQPIRKNHTEKISFFSFFRAC
jgi:hypothetical protein